MTEVGTVAVGLGRVGLMRRARGEEEESLVRFW